MLSRHVSVVVHRPVAEVYSFAVDPDNLPRWASGLAQGDVHRDGDTLLVDSPMGRVTVTFTPTNDLGVLDHDVVLPDGEVVTNPLRVIAHPDGSELVFTVRQRAMTDDDFDRDTETIESDLATLREILEDHGDVSS